MELIVKPTYVTFQQAKSLKEIGFDIHCHNRITSIIDSSGKYTTPDNFNKYANAISLPEQHQVTEWLRIKYEIWISVNLEELTNEDKTLKYNFICHKIKDNSKHSIVGLFESPQDAYSAAFDYILNKLKTWK